MYFAALRSKGARLVSMPRYVRPAGLNFTS